MSLVPLESNPEVMTKLVELLDTTSIRQLLHKLGVPKKWNIVDVYGLDPDSLAFLLKPVLAMLLLYPETEKKESAENFQEADTNVSSSIYFLRQFLSNVCGTIAIIHSVANNLDEIKLEDGFLKAFLEKTKNLSSTERGELLVKEESLIKLHKELSQEGQSEIQNEATRRRRHYVTFVQKDGHIYELSGGKISPINRGPSTPDSFLEDAARVCQEYMKRDPNEISYTMLALAPTL